MDIIKLNKNQLDGKRVIKKDTVWTDEKLIYKKCYSFESKVEDYDILYLLNNGFKNLVMPKQDLYVSDKPFGYVTDYLSKYKTIRNYIKSNNIPYKQKLVIIKKIVSSIKNMHNQIEITHGDLNPSNIMIMNNDIKIIDFDNIGIKGLTSDKYYKSKKLDDMKCLVLLILNIIGESDFNFDGDLHSIIDLMDISNEFKKYLYDCISYKDSVIGVYPEEYIKELTGTVEFDFKKKVRNLK